MERKVRTHKRDLAEKVEQQREIHSDHKEKEIKRAIRDEDKKTFENMRQMRKDQEKALDRMRDQDDRTDGQIREIIKTAEATVDT